MIEQPGKEIRSCRSGKVGYPTKQKAYKMAQSLKGPKGRTLMRVYKCPDCKQYHLTHIKDKYVA